MITIWGTIDAELSDLTLEGADGSETITLSPVFAVNTYTYTAAVVNQIDTVKLTATKTDDNATVVITNDDDDRHGRGGAARPQRRVQHTNGYRDGAERRRANLYGHRRPFGGPTTGNHGTQRLGPDSLRSRHRRPVPADVPLLHRYRRHVRRHRGLQHLHPEPRRSRPCRHPGLQSGFPCGGLHRRRERPEQHRHHRRGRAHLLAQRQPGRR